jgi:hypothetical protein
MATIAVEVSLETVTCCHRECGVTFAVPTDWAQQRRRDHSWWYCPNGHQQHWGGKTKEEKEIDRLRAQLDQSEAAERELRREKDRLANDLMDKAKELKRVHRRAHAGVCPHCTRTFANVQRHMAKQHPEEHEKVLVKAPAGRKRKG